MGLPRFKIAKLMAIVVSAAIWLAVFRFGSFTGLVALLPLGVTVLISRLGSTQSVRRYAFWLGSRDARVPIRRRHLDQPPGVGISS